MWNPVKELKANDPELRDLVANVKQVESGEGIESEQAHQRSPT